MRKFSSKDFFVNPDIGKAETLPDSAFNDPDFLQLELDTIFRRSWMLVPQGAAGRPALLGDLLSRPGSRVPFSLLGKPLFLQRNARKEIDCFPNVCTHAWHPLVESASIGGSIVCPQHGREFDSDGRFVSHKGFEKLENFPRETDNLRRMHVENWGPLVSICVGEPLASFKRIAEKVEESIPGVNLESLKYRPCANEIREVDGNWKQHAWNYMDNYHIRFVHKGPSGLADVIDLESYTTELYEHSALQWAYARRPEDGFDPERVATRFRDPKDSDRQVLALWWFIFPNLTLNFYPWGLSVNQYLPAPGRPDRTEFHWLQYSIDDAKFEQRNKIWLNEQVDTEDIEAISLVSKGAQSGFAPRGRFAPREEQGPHWLHRLIYTTVFGEY